MGHVAVDDDGAVLPHEAHELAEGLLDVLERAVVVEMVGLDVSDHDDVRVEVEEGAVGLVRLADEVAAVAVLAVGVVALDDAADEEGRVEAELVEHRGDHGGRSRLSVGAGDGDRRGVVGEIGEHLCARPDGDAQLAGAQDLGVGLGDGGGGHDDLRHGGVDGGRLMAHVDLDAGVLELADIMGCLKVAAGDLAAALVQHQGDAAHPRSADTDEVRALDLRVGRDLGHECPSRNCVTCRRAAHAATQPNHLLYRKPRARLASGRALHLVCESRGSGILAKALRGGSHRGAA